MRAEEEAERADAGSNPAAPANTRAQLGVLFIHGIGSQKRGETLIQGAEPLRDWLQRWHSNGSAYGDEVSIGHASLVEDPRDVGAPAHAEMSIRGAEGTRQWLLAESWWAEAFAPVTYSELAWWSVNVLPPTLTGHFGTRLRRAWTSDGQTKGRMEWLEQRAMSIVEQAVSLVLLPFLALLILLMLVIGWIPIDWVRNAAAAVSRMLSSSLGDSMVLLDSPVRSAAIQSRVRADLEWLCAGCQDVVVIAHSQGAAIAHAVLRASTPSKVRLFISYGSGLAKLSDLRSARMRGPGVVEAWLPQLGLGIVALAVLTHVSPWTLQVLGPGFVFENLESQKTLFFGLAFVVTGAVSSMRSRSDQERAALQLPQVPRWIDVFSTSDPVPNGQLFDEGSIDNVIESVEVRNRGSSLSDHTSYWKGTDDFVALVAREVGTLGDFPFGAPEPAAAHAAASKRRQWRVGCWEVAHQVAVVLGLVIVFADVPGFEDKAVEPFKWMATHLTGVFDWARTLEPCKQGVEQCRKVVSFHGVSVLVFGTCLIVAYQVQRALWWGWDRSECNALFERRSYSVFPLQLLALWTVLAAEAHLVLLAVAHSLAGFGTALLVTFCVGMAVWLAWFAIGKLQLADRSACRAAAQVEVLITALLVWSPGAASAMSGEVLWIQTVFGGILATAVIIPELRDRKKLSLRRK